MNLEEKDERSWNVFNRLSVGRELEND